MANLDPAYVKAWCERAKGAKFMGVPVEDMTRDELMAMAMAGWVSEACARRDAAYKSKGVGAW